MKPDTSIGALAKTVAFGLGLAALCGGALGNVAYYIGYDEGAGSVGANAAAAAARFDTDVGTHRLVDFETALPADLSIVGGEVVGAFGCTPALCGFNTTAGGSRAYSGRSRTVTFSFTHPVWAFGAYFSGVELANTLAFDDGEALGTAIPGVLSIGGVAFVGFTDAGRSFSSVVLELRHGSMGDNIGIDDLRFAAATAPEPGTWAMLGAGLAGLGWLRRAKPGRVAR